MMFVAATVKVWLVPLVKSVMVALVRSPGTVVDPPRELVIS
jgi:hypothetical protein